jgi:hypothetical protein
MEHKLNKLAHFLVKKFSIVPYKYYNELFFTDIYNKLVVIYNHCVQYNDNDNFWKIDATTDIYANYCDELTYLIIGPNNQIDKMNELYWDFTSGLSNYVLTYLIINFSELNIKCDIPVDYAKFIEE